MSDEYPKVLHLDGVTVTVLNAAEEDRWQHAPKPSVQVPDLTDPVEPADSLDDITVEMDDPARNEPVTPKPPRGPRHPRAPKASKKK